MARLMTFKTMVEESISNNDAKEFQAIVKKKLTESLNSYKKQMIQSIVEELDSNFSKAVAIGNAAKSFGAKNFIYEDGVLRIVVPNHDAVEHFSDFLEESNDIDSYEIHALVESDPQGSPVDLEVAKHSPDTNFEFSIYFESAYDSEGMNESRVVFLEKKDEDEDEDEDDEDDDEDDEDDDDEDEDDDDEDEDDDGKKNTKEGKKSSKVNPFKKDDDDK